MTFSSYTSSVVGYMYNTRNQSTRRLRRLSQERRPLLRWLDNKSLTSCFLWFSGSCITKDTSLRGILLFGTPCKFILSWKMLLTVTYLDGLNGSKKKFFISWKCIRTAWKYVFGRFSNLGIPENMYFPFLKLGGSTIHFWTTHPELIFTSPFRRELKVWARQYQSSVWNFKRSLEVDLYRIWVVL